MIKHFKPLSKALGFDYKGCLIFGHPFIAECDVEQYYPPPRLRVRRVLSRSSEACSKPFCTVHLVPCTFSVPFTLHLHTAPALRTSHPHLDAPCTVSWTLYLILVLVWCLFKGPQGRPLKVSKSPFGALKSILGSFFSCSKQRSKNEGPEVHLDTQTGPCT